MTLKWAETPPLRDTQDGRPDAASKATGDFSFASDLWIDGMLWGATLRSSLPHARIRSIDTSAARRIPGVRAVLTNEDVPGRKTFGLTIADQPVLAFDEVRFAGEPIALVAADELHVAREALDHIEVDYYELESLTDPRLALLGESPQLHAEGNLIRHFQIRKGDCHPSAEVVVRSVYEVGIQDQAALGPESALVVPTADGGLELYVATQCVYTDLRQICASLDLPVEKIRVCLSGVGGAFGGREDISVQIHCSLLATATDRPVKMMYSRDESFVGRPHRHPARMIYEHGSTGDGRLVYVKAQILLDGGAYASTSGMVAKNAGSFAVGPYDVPNVVVDVDAVYTNNPPAGSMRGMGVPQVCFAHESQMNRLAERLGMDPIELRLKNCLRDPSILATGQRLAGPVPVEEILRRLRRAPLPSKDPGPRDSTLLPGGISNTTHGEGVHRGVAYAIGMKGFCFSEGYDDFSTASVRLSVPDEKPLVEVCSAAAEMGQGILAVQMKIARAELKIDRVSLVPADTTLGSAGSSSASRQTYMTGGAVQLACRLVKEELFDRVRKMTGWGDQLHLTVDGVKLSSGAAVSFADLLQGGEIEKRAEYRHPKTDLLDPETGQGDAFVSFMFAGHRAVVDVDRDLGLVRVVELATVQDVGHVIFREGVEGQIEGGSAQGLGLALMEDLLVTDGYVSNGSFTDYLIPTSMDMPTIRSEILEYHEPTGPLGVKGAGEAPTVSSGAAIAGAVERAAELEIGRIPVRPEDIVTRAPR